MVIRCEEPERSRIHSQRRRQSIRLMTWRMLGLFSCMEREQPRHAITSVLLRR